jgi:DnaK suppressor protein
MKHLSDSDRHALAKELEAMKALVLAELRESAAGAQAGSPETAHEVRSHADEAETARLNDVHFAEVDIDRLRLSEIEQAQRRMTDGRYGICIDCGEDIPRERLLARPMAIRCASCQVAAESHQRRHDALT